MEEISNINEVPEEIRWDITLALILEMGQTLHNASEWAVQNSRNVTEFDGATRIRSNVEALADICEELVNALIEQRENED